MKNLVAFFEIPAVNFERTVKFYEAVLNVKLSFTDCETEKMAFFPEEDGKCLGSVSWAKDFNPSKDGVLVHLHVENMEAAVDAIEKNGGKITRPKTKIEVEGMGYFALFIDSEGNRVGLYSEK
ncbi:MAG: VOC family protein [Prevotellaceae bacterium]|jgi:predicted enzyme related to lactoylglutathione lyase|nr:VOC family protein [Prevotellaceae bacterium]